MAFLILSHLYSLADNVLMHRIFRREMAQMGSKLSIFTSMLTLGSDMPGPASCPSSGIPGRSHRKQDSGSLFPKMLSSPILFCKMLTSMLRYFAKINTLHIWGTLFGNKYICIASGAVTFYAHSFLSKYILLINLNNCCSFSCFRFLYFLINSQDFVQSFFDRFRIENR